MRESDIKKGHAEFKDPNLNKYEVIEVESGYIYHWHAFNTSTYVPYRVPIEKPSDATLDALKSIYSTWKSNELDADMIYAQITALIAERDRG